MKLHFFVCKPRRICKWRAGRDNSRYLLKSTITAGDDKYWGNLARVGGWTSFIQQQESLLDKGMNATMWVQQNLLKLHKMFGMLGSLMIWGKGEWCRVWFKIGKQTVCLQETKLEGNVQDIVKQIWAGRWIRCAFLEASGRNSSLMGCKSMERGNFIGWSVHSIL